jgi:hypothetical protein
VRAFAFALRRRSGFDDLVLDHGGVVALDLFRLRHDEIGQRLGDADV